MEETQTAYDIAVVGAGAAGLAAAIRAARTGAHVVLLERDVAPGLSLLATGNGRCNLSNAHLGAEHYFHPDSVPCVMGATPAQTLAEFFDSIGLLTISEDGWLYPASKRAESVRSALLTALDRAGVQVICGVDLEEARYAAGTWELNCCIATLPASPAAEMRTLRRALAQSTRHRSSFYTRCVIVACGGNAKTPCELFDLPYIPERPVLCPLACRPTVAGEYVDALWNSCNGLRAEAVLTLVRSGERVYQERGELLFRVYGLSGIVAFNMSRRVCTGDILALDVIPQMSDVELLGYLRLREKTLGAYEGHAAWLDGVLARPLSALICALCPSCQLVDLAYQLKHCALALEGVTEESRAQVQRGGVSLDALDLSTLAVLSSHSPSLYVCGEALDQDADCGGFNLAWAWTSGLRAGESAARACRDALRVCDMPPSAAVHKNVREVQGLS